jgi:prepilin signal peptidase PulO-like enzyme (type II secretory pathway)
MDIRERRIPNYLTLGGFLLILLVKILIGNNSVSPYLISSALSFAVMAGVSLLTRDKLGMGDVKLSLSIGGILGVYYWLISLFLASLTALIFVFPFLLSRKMKRSDPIPFAPFLSLGALLTLWLKGKGYSI